MSQDQNGSIVSKWIGLSAPYINKASSVPFVANKKWEKPKTKNKKKRKQHMYDIVFHHEMSPKGHTGLIIGVSRAK